MTGLDKILGQIADYASSSAKDELDASQKKVDALLQKAKTEGEDITKQILAQGQAKADDIRQRAVSASDLDRRNTMLNFKQGFIDDVIAKTRDSLSALPDDEYFATLLKLVKKYAQNEPATMKLNTKDLARLPADFQSKATSAAGNDITVSQEPANIPNGFLLIYEGIDINCSFDAIFEDQMDEIRDRTSSVLFSQE